MPGRKETTLGRIVIFNLKIPPPPPPARNKPEHSYRQCVPGPQDSRFSSTLSSHDCSQSINTVKAESQKFRTKTYLFEAVVDQQSLLLAALC